MKRETSFKRQGELAELAFLNRVARLGHIVSQPYGETAHYDFIVDASGRLTRVQVRSARVATRGAYKVSCCTGSRIKTPLTPRDADLLAAYLFPEDIWYLVPVQAFSPAKGIWFRPGSRRQFELFREAWPLLSGNPSRPERAMINGTLPHDIDGRSPQGHLIRTADCADVMS